MTKISHKTLPPIVVASFFHPKHSSGSPRVVNFSECRDVRLLTFYTYFTSGFNKLNVAISKQAYIALMTIPFFLKYKKLLNVQIVVKSITRSDRYRFQHQNNKPLP